MPVFSDEMLYKKICPSEQVIVSVQEYEVHNKMKEQSYQQIQKNMIIKREYPYNDKKVYCMEYANACIGDSVFLFKKFFMIFKHAFYAEASAAQHIKYVVVNVYKNASYGK